MKKRSIVRSFGALPLLLIASAVGAQPVVYRLVDLGPSSATQVFSFGINDSGTGVGFTSVLGPTGKEARALRSVSDMFIIPPGLDRHALGLGINANGDVAGGLVVSPWPSYLEHVMRYTDSSGVEDLGTGPFGGSAEGLSINRFGQIAGWFAWGSGSRAFASEPWGLRDLGTLGGPSAVAYAINDSGTVVGTATVADGSTQAFVAPPNGTMRSLGASLIGARGINNLEQIAGSFLLADRHSHPYRYTPGVGIENLDPEPFRNSDAYAINGHGDVVGWFRPVDSVFPHAFVYSDAEGFVDLNSRIVSGGDGWTVIRGTGINSSGEIVAQAFGPGSFSERAVKLIPADLVPPVIESASADPSVLWPPDGRMVPVTIMAAATDNSDPVPACAIAAVNVVDDGADPTDAQIAGPLSLRLRARRTTQSAIGRTYEVTVACLDVSGNRASVKVNVSVPHDSGK